MEVGWTSGLVWKHWNKERKFFPLREIETRYHLGSSRSLITTLTELPLSVVFRLSFYIYEYWREGLFPRIPGFCLKLFSIFPWKKSLLFCLYQGEHSYLFALSYFASENRSEAQWICSTINSERKYDLRQWLSRVPLSFTGVFMHVSAFVEVVFYQKTTCC
jgi:hypothetical protein